MLDETKIRDAIDRSLEFGFSLDTITADAEIQANVLSLVEKAIIAALRSYDEQIVSQK